MIIFLKEAGGKRGRQRGRGIRRGEGGRRRMRRRRRRRIGQLNAEFKLTHMEEQCICVRDTNTRVAVAEAASCPPCIHFFSFSFINGS
jgi:hypothetical protein